MLELLVELEPDVLDAQQVLPRVAEPLLGFPTPLAVFRYPGRLFQEYAQLLGLRLDDARDHALLDDRVRARAEPGAEKYVGDVAPPHMDIVDVIRRLAVALQHALDRNLAVARPLPAGFAEAVVEHQLDAGAIYQLAVARAVEQHVLHRLAAQMTGRRFTQHPAHGVDHVGFAAAVGTDDSHQLAGHGYVSGVYKGFKACELDFCKAQFFLRPVEL
jgi:hypothetical protein